MPAGFVKIRHYGLLAPAHVHRTLAQARQLLTPTPAPDSQPPSTARTDDPAPTTWCRLFFDLTGIDLTRCHACGRGIIIRHPLPAASPHTPPSAFDTS